MTSKNAFKPAFFVLSLGLGGTEQQLRNLLYELCRREIPCLLVLGQDESFGLAELSQAGVEVVKVPLSGSICGVRDVISWMSFLRKALKKRGATHLQSFLPVPNLLSVLIAPFCRIPIFLSERNVAIPHGRIARCIRKLFYPWARALVCNSVRVQRWVQDFYGFPTEFLPVICNGFPQKGKLDSKRTPQLEAKIVVLTVASYKPQKGHAFLLEAWKNLAKQFPEAELRLIGSGNSRPVQQKIGEEGLEGSVKILKPSPDLTPVYAEADLFCLPSVAEGFPNVIIEAMNFGLPVVATDVGGVSEIIENGVNGVIVPSKSASALTTELGNLLRDRDRRLLLGEKALQRGKAFSVEKLAENYLQMFASRS